MVTLFFRRSIPFFEVLFLIVSIFNLLQRQKLLETRMIGLITRMKLMLADLLSGFAI